MLNRKTSNIKISKFRTNFQKFAILPSHVVWACTVLHQIRLHITFFMDTKKLSLDCNIHLMLIRLHDITLHWIINVIHRRWWRMLETKCIDDQFILPAISWKNQHRTSKVANDVVLICKWRLSSKTMVPRFTTVSYLHL